MGTLHFGVAGDLISARTIMANRSEEPLDAKSAWTCLCVCAFVCTCMSGRVPPFFFRSYFFPSLKIKTPAQASFSIQICPREDAGGEGGEKMKHSSTSFLRGNRKRLRERDSGARSLGTMKISL